MTQFDNTDKGALFKNDRRTKDTQPNLRGQINVGGVEYWLSGWTKEIQNGPRAGEHMISLAVTPKEEGQRNYGGSPPAQGQDDFDEDIPF